MLVKVLNRFFILLFVLCSTGLPQTTLPTVAILDFEARNVDQTAASTLSDRLATELGNTGAVILVERKQLERIMEEQGLQQSGCVSDECVAKVGELLGVQFMVSGSVNLLGRTYTVDIKMFSVETGANTKTINKTHQGKIDELIPIMESIAWELVELEKKGKKSETVAVLDFEGRGISAQEAATLTDRFTSSLGKTEAILIVARQEMNEILKEQGYQQQEGCTSAECAAEVGAMIGVKNIINGSIGKVGETYTIDAQMINVSSGATVKSVNKTYAGKVDGLIIEIEMMAWDIVSLKPPKELIRRQQMGTPVASALPKPKTKTGAMIRSAFIPGTGQIYSGKKRWGYGWMAAELVLIGMAYKSNSDYLAAEKNYLRYHALYDQSTDTDLIAAYRKKSTDYHTTMKSVNSRTTMYIGLAGGVWLLNAIHAYIVGPRPDNETAGLTDYLAFAYDSTTRSTQIQWNIPLD